MKRTFKTLLLLVGIAMLGVLAGVAVAGMDAATGAASPTATSAELTSTDGPVTPGLQTTTDGATTTEPGTTTGPATTGPATTGPATTTEPTTTAGTTAPATTTDPTTTTAPVTTVDTTTAPPTTTDGTMQSTPQTTTQPPATGGTTAQTQTQPCQTPTNPGVTCGNNAATQLAVVTQNCESTASVATGGLSIQILNPDGSVAKSVGIDNKSICLNYSQITQIVQQICVNCTLVVQNYYSTTNQTIVNGWTGPRYVGYCMPADRPRMRGDGTVGWLVFIGEGRPSWDPQYAGATLAPFDAVNGYTCPGTASAPVPNTFTLTVPAALIGQFVNLCLQPSDPTAKPVCHSVQIDASSRITIPVRSNITASVTKAPKSKLVSRANSSAAAGLLAGKKKHCAASVKSKTKAKAKVPARKSNCVIAKKTKKGSSK